MGGAENENPEVHNTAGNQEARAENEPPGVPAATQVEEAPTEPQADAPAEEPPRRPKRDRRAVTGPLGPVINEDVESLNIQFVISSDTEEEEHADRGEDSVGNNDISLDESSDDADVVEEEYDDQSSY